MVMVKTRAFLPDWIKRALLVLLALYTMCGESTLFAAVPGTEGEDADLPAVAEGEKSFDELLAEAQELIVAKRPIDARAKLQKAMLLNPRDYRPPMLLGEYYLFDVGHFTLAYRYIRTAEDLFMKQNANSLGVVDPTHTREHATLLYFRAEAELNLDKYQDSLATLDRFGGLYWTDWYPGTRAWVLMKLKRIDEAIAVAQAALIDPTNRTDRRRTYNILGILLSVKGSRELSLTAFQQAIAAEVALGSIGQVATPLNNAGEVYRELFRDSLAEASWIRATRLPDGCDHILPSLNLSILYVDENRFLQAERTLSDFEACFAQQGERDDTEHRALLALARGRIALRKGDVDEAIKDLTLATERQQWFGKIGTNEDDVRFASTITMAQALKAKIAALHDTARDSWSDTVYDLMSEPALRLRVWWLFRDARRQGVADLSDLEDLFIRNTDTMVEYPTFGDMLSGFPTRSFEKRYDRLIKDDQREQAHLYYKLYLAENLAAHGNDARALILYKEVLQGLRPIDNLARSQVLADILISARNLRHFWQTSTHNESVEDIRMREELFGLLPSHLRFNDLLLPVTFVASEGKFNTKFRSRLSARFEIVGTSLASVPRFEVQLASVESSEGTQVSISLLDKTLGKARVSETAVIKQDGTGMGDLVNKFISSVFSHRADPASEPVPKLELLEGIM